MPQTKPGRRPRKPELTSKLKEGETPPEGTARVIAAGLGSNACAAWEWSRLPFGDVNQTVDLTALLNQVVSAAERVNDGDLGDQEAILTAQAVTLNAMFVNLAGRAERAKLFDHFERFLRLAFRAQSQCRATCETLALLKNPPVFARQANIATQQLVSNGPVLPARAGNLDIRPSGLLEAAHVERLDLGAAGEASQGHPALAPVGALDRPADGGGEGHHVAERIPRRSAAHPARAGQATAKARRGPGGQG